MYIPRIIYAITCTMLELDDRLLVLFNKESSIQHRIIPWIRLSSITS